MFETFKWAVQNVRGAVWIQSSLTLDSRPLLDTSLQRRAWYFYMCVLDHVRSEIVEVCEKNISEFGSFVEVHVWQRHEDAYRVTA